MARSYGAYERTLPEVGERWGQLGIARFEDIVRFGGNVCIDMEDEASDASITFTQIMEQGEPVDLTNPYGNYAFLWEIVQLRSDQASPGLGELIVGEEVQISGIPNPDFPKYNRKSPDPRGDWVFEEGGLIVFKNPYGGTELITFPPVVGIVVDAPGQEQLRVWSPFEDS